MPRTLRVYWPSVRNTPGSSFGPITISATTPINRNSLQLISNMKTPRPPRPPAACLAGRGDRREGAASARPCSRTRRAGLGRFHGLVLGHALLEGFDALGDVAHHVRNLAAAAEDQKQHGADDQPMPDAQ